MVSHSGRLFVYCEQKGDASDSGTFFEYNNGNWSQFGKKHSVQNSFSRFYSIGNNLYNVIVESGKTLIQKLGSTEFVTVGNIISDPDNYLNKISLSQDSFDRPVLVIESGAFPAGSAKVYRLENGAWTLMKQFFTTGNMDGVSLFNSSGKLLLMYDNDGSTESLALDEVSGKWIKFADLESNLRDNVNQMKIISTNTGLYFICASTSGLTVRKYLYCNGY